MRCCLRPPLVAAACLIATSLHSASADRVLVVGADATLLHDATTASSTPPALAARFSPAGLAQLAMDALGVPTGSLVRLASDASVDAKDQLLVQSPVQADVFARVDAYAMVFVDSADADVLTTVDAAATSGYHKIFDLTPDGAAGPSTKIPGVIASALKDSVGARVECAGSALVCTSEALPAADPTRAQLDQVYARYGFLDRTKAADVALATELAQTQQLTAGIASDSATAPNALFAVNFGGVAALSGKTKQTDARHAIATEVQALLRALQQKYPTSSGAQVVATSRSAATTNVAVSPTAVESLVAYSRMLLSFNEKIGSASLDEDDDDDDLLAVNGTTSDITIEDIAEYQIVLWTSVILGAVLLLVIIAMCNMNNKRDSLLYAKFTTSNGGRKYD